jgi:hypothetical protein
MFYGRPPRVRGRRRVRQGASRPAREDPRVCGDDIGRLLAVALKNGRPRMCGDDAHRVARREVDVRKTPACAGTTSHRTRRPTRSGEDPRVCGDDLGGPDLRPGLPRKTRACAGTTPPATSRPPSTPEDPRVCGDDLRAERGQPAERGKTPRVRGRPVGAAVAAGAPGKTPACAGTTAPGISVTSSSEEDPRVCGDDGATKASIYAQTGRPPRVRGRRVDDRAAPHLQGKTPACAGTTLSIPDRPTSAREDPRVCGDDETTQAVTLCHGGRPPRVRGRRDVVGGAYPDRGKTPACAGTTSRPCRGRSAGTEDPRVCGDDRSRTAWRSARTGRPPRVRGRPTPTLPDPRAGGKTPACAGTTVLMDEVTGVASEDPRVCGDDGSRSGTPSAREGRPPRVRGRPRRLPELRRRVGKTPACAGTTGPLAPARQARREDPRVCGDDTC